MAKYLIINADDYGMCASANEAVEELFELGRLKSATVMMPCRAKDAAIDFAIKHPEHAIGVHLTMTSEWQSYRWAPLTDSPSLKDEAGYMHATPEAVEKNAKYDELEKEIRAQLDLAVSMGLTPSHADNHMGSLYGNRTMRPGILALVMRILGEYGLSYRLYTKVSKQMVPRGTPYAVYKLSTLYTRFLAAKYKVILPDYLLFPDWTKELREGGYENYRRTMLRLWTEIPDGVTETFLHPCLETDEIKSITGSWRNRVWEYEIMKDPETHAYLESKGVSLISYRDLRRIKNG